MRAPRRNIVSIVIAFALIAPFGGALASSPSAGPNVRHTRPDYKNGRPLPIRAAQNARYYAGSSNLGDRKIWFALDDHRGQIYTKSYELLGMGRRSEVWVAQDLSFPPGDCRNDARITVTDAQIKDLIREFDDNIYPKESAAFSRPPARDGTHGEAPEYIDVGRRYYRGPGGRIVVLVDNVRDANFYDADNAENNPYIIGFFYSFFNELTDRNVMTIDAFDWEHRTGADPPHEPDPNDICRSMPARPFLIEETFAHEYQHLLENYEDEGETTWLNEGLSDWAQTLTGYADPTRTVEDRGFDRHIECFLGWCNQRTEYNPNPSDQGAENSLTQWEDEGSEEILADYGAAYTFMELVEQRYGREVMRGLHRNDYDGLRSLRRVLRFHGVRDRVNDIVADWAAALALDQVLDDGAILHGEARSLQVPTLTGRVNWSTRHMHDSPGAPPNGSDYVRLRDAAGSFLGAGNIESLTFSVPALPAQTSVSLQLIAYDDTHDNAWFARIPIREQMTITLSGTQLDGLIGTSAETVAAIVTFHDYSEDVSSSARYSLEVNGVLQSGG